MQLPQLARQIQHKTSTMQASLHTLQQGLAAGCCCNSRVAASNLLIRPSSAFYPQQCTLKDVYLEGIAEQRIARRRSRRWLSAAVPLSTATASTSAAPGIAIEPWTGSPAQLQASQLHMPQLLGLLHSQDSHQIH
jgi:hypothetical protein